MIKALGAVACAAVLVAGCSTPSDDSSMPLPGIPSETLQMPEVSVDIPLTREQAAAEMVRLACDAGFDNFPDLGTLPSECETYILSMAPDGGIEPLPYQLAREEGRPAEAAALVQSAWDETWVDWLSGAVLVCDRTRQGPQAPSDREITLAALETVVPGFSTRIYTQATAVFCPALAPPVETSAPPDAATTAQGAVDVLCRTPVSQLPDLVYAGDSPYWTEVVQVLAVSEGIRVGPIDGQYGPQTIAGVQQLQLLVGVVDDGQVGPITWTALQDYFC